MGLRKLSAFLLLCVALAAADDLFKKGFSYNYDLKVSAVSKAHNGSKSTDMGYECEVKIRKLQDTEYDLQMTNCKLEEKLAEKELSVSPNSKKFDEELKAHPVMFEMDNNEVTSVKFHKSETLMAKNIKRSIISTLLSSDDVPTGWERKTDIFGDCAVKYNYEHYSGFEDNTKYISILINMERNLDECVFPSKKGWGGSQTQINVNATTIMSMFGDSKSGCVYKYGEGRIFNVVCTDEHSYMTEAIEMPGVGLTSKVQISLEIKEMKKSESVESLDESNYEESSIVFEHEEPEEDEYKSGPEMDSVHLEKATEAFLILAQSEEASAQTIASFENVVLHLSEVKQPLNKFIDDHIKCELVNKCGTDKDKKRSEDYLVDHMRSVLLECNTENCLDGFIYMNSKNLRAFNWGKEKSFQFWIYADVASEKMIEKMTAPEMFSGCDEHSFCYAYSGIIVRKMYEKKRQEYGKQIPKELANAVNNILAKKDEGNLYNKLTAIGNMGEVALRVDSDLIDWLLSKMEMSTASQSHYLLRLQNKAVVSALRNMDPSDRIYNELMKIYKNDELNIESRVLAYRTILQKYPSEANYRKLLSYIESTPLKHPMRRFVLSHIKNYMMTEENQNKAEWTLMKNAMKPYLSMFEDEYAFGHSSPRRTKNIISGMDDEEVFGYHWLDSTLAKALDTLDLHIDFDVMRDFGHYLPNSVFSNVSIDTAGGKLNLGHYWKYMDDIDIAAKLTKYKNFYDTGASYKTLMKAFYLYDLFYNYIECPDNTWDLAAKDDALKTLIPAVRKLKKQITNTEYRYCGGFSFTEKTYKGNVVKNLYQHMQIDAPIIRVPRVTGYYAIPSAAGFAHTISTYLHAVIMIDIKYGDGFQTIKPSVAMKIENKIRISLPKKYSQVGLDAITNLETHLEFGFTDGNNHLMNIRLPKDKLTLVSFSHRNMYVSGEGINTFLNNAETDTNCMDKMLEGLTGYKTCKEESLKEDATDFYSYKLTTEKVDQKLEAIEVSFPKTSNDANKFELELKVKAPGDKYQREIVAKVVHDKSDENIVKSHMKVTVPDFPSVDIGYDFTFNKKNYDHDLEAKFRILNVKFFHLKIQKTGPTDEGKLQAYFNASTHYHYVSSMLHIDKNQRIGEFQVACHLPKDFVEEEELTTHIPIEFWGEDEQTLGFDVLVHLESPEKLAGNITLPRHVTDFVWMNEINDRNLDSSLHLSMYKTKTPNDKHTVIVKGTYEGEKSYISKASLEIPYRTLTYTRTDESNTVGGDDEQSVDTQLLVYKRHDPQTKEDTEYEFKLVTDEQSSCKNCGVYPGVNEEDVISVTTKTLYFPLRGKQHHIKTMNYLVTMDFGGSIEESVFNTKLMVSPISFIEILGGNLDLNMDVMHTPSGAMTKNNIKGKFNWFEESEKVKVDFQVTSLSKSHDFQWKIKYYEDGGIEKLSQQSTLKSDVWKDIEFTSTSSSEIYPTGDKTNWMNEDSKYKEGTTTTRTHWLEPKPKYFKRTTVFNHDKSYKLVPSMTWETRFQDFKDYFFRVTYPNSKEMVYLAANVSDDYMTANLLAEYTDASGEVHHFGSGTLEPLLPYTMYISLKRNESLSEDLEEWVMMKGGQVKEELIKAIEAIKDPNHPVNKIWSPILGGKTVAEYLVEKVHHATEVADNIVTAIVEPEETWEVGVHPFVKLVYKGALMMDTDDVEKLINENTAAVGMGSFLETEALEEILETQEISRHGFSYLTKVFTTYRSFSNFKTPPSSIKTMAYEFRNPSTRTAEFTVTPMFHMYTFDDRPINFHMNKDDCPMLLAHDLFTSNYTLTATRNKLTFLYTPANNGKPREAIEIHVDLAEDPIVVTGSVTDVNGKTETISLPYNHKDDDIHVYLEDRNLNIKTKSNFDIWCCSDCLECKIKTSVWNTNDTIGLLGNADGFPSDDMKLPNAHLTKDVTEFAKAYLLDQSEECKAAVQHYDSTMCKDEPLACDNDAHKRLFSYYTEDCKYKSKCGFAIIAEPIYENRLNSIYSDD